jgi:hypothetical protein
MDDRSKRKRVLIRTFAMSPSLFLPVNVNSARNMYSEMEVGVMQIEVVEHRGRSFFQVGGKRKRTIHCPEAQQSAFPTRELAQRAHLKRVTPVNGQEDEAKPAPVWQCNYCDGWHCGEVERDQSTVTLEEVSNLVTGKGTNPID